MVWNTDMCIRHCELPLGDNQIAVLRSFQQYLPISLSGKQMTVDKVLQETLIQAHTAKKGDAVMIPLRALVNIDRSEDIKTIVAGKNGEYIPLNYHNTQNPERIINKTDEVIQENKSWDVVFSGAFFSNKKMLGELVVILLVSVLLMYFILASHSSFLPLIVLAKYHRYWFCIGDTLPRAIPQFDECHWANRYHGDYHQRLYPKTGYDKTNSAKRSGTDRQYTLRDINDCEQLL